MGEGTRRSFDCRSTVPVTGDFEAGVQLEFFQNIVDVALNGVDCKIKPVGDLLVAEPFGNQLNNLALSLRHADRFERVTPAVAGGMIGDLGEE